VAFWIGLWWYHLIGSQCLDLYRGRRNTGLIEKDLLKGESELFYSI